MAGARQQDPHYNLDVLHSARLRIKVHMALSPNESPISWLKDNGIFCDYRKIVSPSNWRISYGVLTRFAKALGYRKADSLYKDLTSQ